MAVLIVTLGGVDRRRLDLEDASQSTVANARFSGRLLRYVYRLRNSETAQSERSVSVTLIAKAEHLAWAEGIVREHGVVLGGEQTALLTRASPDIRDALIAQICGKLRRDGTISAAEIAENEEEDRELLLLRLPAVVARQPGLD